MGEEAPLVDAGGDPRLVMLRRQLLRVELALPDAAIAYDLFDRTSWLQRLRAARTAPDLRGCLSELENAMLPGFLVKEFVRQPNVVPG
eukprot:203542-Chlamydomonas_euryale.AAC.1